MVLLLYDMQYVEFLPFDTRITRAMKSFFIRYSILRDAAIQFVCFTL